MRQKALLTGLALAALFFAILLPPEAYPDGKLAVIVCATFAFFGRLSEKRIGSGYAWGGLALFTFLLLHTALFSVDLYRSLEFITVVWCYYCLAGFFLHSPFAPSKSLSAALVGLAAIVSAYGLYQYFLGFDALYDYIFYSSAERVVKVPALSRIADRRVFSTLALPGTLWGFLVAALPFHAALWRRSGTARWTNLLVAASAAMVMATGFLTRSFGFLAGLFVLAAAWLLLRRTGRAAAVHARAWAKPAAIVLLLGLLLGVAGLSFYAARRGVIESSNPAALRLKNWISAWTIFAANPAGTGLNTYGVMYPQYMLPHANETQYAHNTPLQLLSELGYPFLLAAGMLLLAGWKAAKSGPKKLPLPVLLAFIVWCVHNLIDIDVYFPSVGVLGAVLLGTLFWKKQGLAATPGRLPAAAMAGLGIAVLGFSALVMVSSELQNRAQAEYEENRLSAAAASLENAQALMPINSSLYHTEGDVLLNLYHHRKDPALLDAATEAFRTAIALSPEKAGPHIGLSLSLGSANRVDDALAELRAAQRLYPDSTYIQSIARLMEQRRTAASN